MSEAASAMAPRDDAASGFKHTHYAPQTLGPAAVAPRRGSAAVPFPVTEGNGDADTAANVQLSSIAPPSWCLDVMGDQVALHDCTVAFRLPRAFLPRLRAACVASGAMVAGVALRVVPRSFESLAAAHTRRRVALPYAEPAIERPCPAAPTAAGDGTPGCASGEARLVAEPVFDVDAPPRHASVSAGCGGLPAYAPDRERWTIQPPMLLPARVVDAICALSAESATESMSQEGPASDDSLFCWLNGNGTHLSVVFPSRRGGIDGPVVRAAKFALAAEQLLHRGDSSWQSLRLPTVRARALPGLGFRRGATLVMCLEPVKFKAAIEELRIAMALARTHTCIYMTLSGDELATDMYATVSLAMELRSVYGGDSAAPTVLHRTNIDSGALCGWHAASTDAASARDDADALVLNLPLRVTFENDSNEAIAFFAAVSDAIPADVTRKTTLSSRVCPALRTDAASSLASSSRPFAPLRLLVPIDHADSDHEGDGHTAPPTSAVVALIADGATNARAVVSSVVAPLCVRLNASTDEDRTGHPTETFFEPSVATMAAGWG